VPVNRALPRPVRRVISELGRLPGIGPKSASRLAFHLLKAPVSQLKELTESLNLLKSSTQLCSICFNITEHDPCDVCAEPSRRSDVICVVEESLDLLAIERSDAFSGRYHVLHGAISPVEGIGPDDLKIAALISRVEAGGIEEIILATNVTLEGDSTALYLQRKLEGRGVKVTRLARGLPVGGDLEYADEVTVGRALEGRQEL